MATKTSYAKDFFKQNPITSIAIVGVTGFVGYRLYKKFFGDKPIIPVVPPIPPVPDRPGGGGTKKQYTYGAQQYADFADLLHDAMYPWGTVEDDIKGVMSKMKTYDDVLALIDAYGRRTLMEWWGGDSDPYTLSQSFYKEMTPSYIQTYVNDPIKRTGYKF